MGLGVLILLCTQFDKLPYVMFLPRTQRLVIKTIIPLPGIWLIVMTPKLLLLKNQNWFSISQMSF